MHQPLLTPASLFRRAIALPADHGSWVFLGSPLLIGLMVGGVWNTATLWLVVAALAAFLARQPISHAVKAASGRRPATDLPVALVWSVVYGGLGLGAMSLLVAQGFGFLLYLAVPAGPVFVWHLWLVSRRAERRQMAVELAGCGVLALAAPAALWVARGAPVTTGWWLWGLSWLQAAASIVYAYLRLEQRAWRVVPPLAERWRAGARALAYTTFNLLAVALAGGLGVLPSWLWVAFALQWGETLWGTLRPAVGAKPVAIGMRQLVVSLLFTVVFIGLWIL